MKSDGEKTSGGDWIHKKFTLNIKMAVKKKPVISKSKFLE